MRFLKKLRLINWHYFNDETIEFHKSGNLITGGTGAGKSTIIDALQVLFVADLRQIKFNQSANDQKSKRDIVSYLRGSINSEGIDYKRGNHDFTSFVVGEIELAKSKKTVLLGVAFDFNSNSKNVYHSFFKVEDVHLSKELFYKNQTTLFTQEDFQVNLKRNQIKHKIYKGDVHGYLNDVKQVLGGVKDSFFKLIQKGISFENITNMKQFIYEFVLDSDPLNSENLRENFERVREMETMIKETEKQIVSLKEIQQKWAVIENLNYGIDTSRYISKKSSVLAEGEKTKKFIGEKGQKEEAYEKLNEIIQVMESKQLELESEIRKLIINIEKHDVSAKMDAIQTEINELNEEITKLQQLQINVEYKIKQEVREREYLGAVLQELEDIDELSSTLNHGKEDWTFILKGLESDLPDLSTFSENNLNQSWRNSFKWIQDQAVLLKQQKDEKEKSKKEVEFKIEELGKNQIISSAHPSQVFKRLLASELRTDDGSEVPVYIVCEVIDVPNELWKNAVEGYLKNLKFNIIVPPKHFNDALQIYDDHKFSHQISGVGLVNIQKMADEKRTPLKGSLAEEITSDISYAKIFTDYALGGLIKCEHIHDLKKYKRSITTSCMVYQNHTARQIPKKDYDVPYIGREAVKLQLIKQKEQLQEIEQELTYVTNHLELCKKLEHLRPDKQDLYADWFNSLKECLSIASKEEELLRLQRQLLEIDTSEVDEMTEQLKLLQRKQFEERNKIGQFKKDSGGLETKINLLIQQIEDASKTKQNKQQEFDEWMNTLSQPAIARCEERWDNVSKENDKDFIKLVEIYENNARSSESRKNNLMGPLIQMRTRFNEMFHFGADATAEDNNAYEERLTFLEDTRLVDYKEKVKERKEKAYHSFQEDFISKLQERIIRSRQIFDALNFSLNKLDFGGDKYKFRCMPNADFIRYYEMIIDNDLILGGLFSETFQEKHKETLEEFFKEISIEENQYSDLMERLMDYRTYLDFEIDIKDRHGNDFKYSKKFGSNSGGESQVPFYIAILASFFHTYQMHRTDPDTFRLVIFDEAFNRMDGERVEECIRFIHQCGFQPVIVTPTTSLQVMAPLLPNVTMVIKHGFTSQVEQLSKDEWKDATKEEEMNYAFE